MSEMLMETYLRQQVDKGEYGVAIIQAQIALDIANYIEKHRQPTIEPERKKGKWIPQDMNKSYGRISTAVYYYPKCSVCGWSADNTNFCPNCGSDMRGNPDD